MRRFFISPENTATNMPVITGADAIHITQVLRYKIGEIIGLFDGRGGEYEARIMALKPGQVHLSILRRAVADRMTPVHITVAQGFLKEKKMDTVVRQLSETGAAEWVPFKAEHSVVALDTNRLAARKARWEKIAIEAAKQCGRNHVISIAPAASFSELLDRYADFDRRIIFWEKESRPLIGALSEKERLSGIRIVIVLGPEGGFATREIDVALARGFETAGLGPRILRAETAAIVACALAQYIFGDMGK